MKRTIVTILIALVAVSCSTTKSGKTIPVENKIAIINGKWMPKTAEINLYEIKNGIRNKIASSSINDDNNFYFAFAPKSEGFYVVGINKNAGINNYTFYFKPGDQLNIEIEGGGRYHLVGQNSPESKEIERWQEYMLPIYEKSLSMQGTYEQFFPLLEEKAGKYEQQYKDNAEFNRTFVMFQKHDMLFNALRFLSSPRTKHPKNEDIIDYYKSFDVSDISGREVLEYPYGMDLLNTYFLMAGFTQKEKFTEQQIKELHSINGILNIMLPLISDDVVKGETVLMFADRLKTIEGYNEFETNYGAYLVTENQRERFKSRLKDIPVKSGEGQPAIDFRLPDTAGKEMALSDFKGKVVYIDVWATWCGPCLNELPYLQKLEKEYHGKDVVFISVSTDKESDREKWLKMVEEKEMVGVQLFGGDKSKLHILDPYKIKSIPRFILVNKDGSLVSDNAPRPSSMEIRPLLDAALKK